jgi:hypothetical protein
MSGMPVGIKPKGALLECFMSFPEFRDDLEVLVREGFVKVTGSEKCEWLKSKTSLAEYFKWAGGDADWVPGGFWAPIESVFGIKRHSLRKLAGQNANPLKPDESRDFKKIKAVLQQLRIKERKEEHERLAFRYIKHLIFCEADLEGDNEEPEKIHRILGKIGAIFIRNVDKNRQKR